MRRNIDLIRLILLDLEKEIEVDLSSYSDNEVNYHKALLIGFFGLCYAMDGGYKRWNPYRERHWTIFVNCF
ncbi:MAG: hypothetical protein EWV53_14810 [Microcystis panniformis Mp_MB_F_20051200_S9]|uniref:Uncharacterized protein n=1 Tax=Microcystis panniformis Mp_MB_F_20051200_S9 TaxID=2486223 RepID=A0A552PTK8_9CHRO|nr:MAG: hypothetical protein EWV43_21055 [Microcystis panniformis Mp_MB_F_20080800_S26D]TRV45082.1 MAG: hypothetical protein EWV42_20500 [Microcystis panniformis Mp_GB_SS_20050300_S99D]TRV45582.1 MAG: hypothetical protein EWV87_17300 [Microcystis panniformis Mp_GB_SS_20050300_S99]TRV55164.1 MAG: hypothetical protein EWV69_20775 [Microcystis panniformis Mp_MB_F_20080800_S26]TRV60328.1 MAG: hypothetical protein EWV53_14810 [Microcystis panniformis Mp_MB_F_20051200_S9]TRV66641.1 MAG: hypothetical